MLYTLSQGDSNKAVRVRVIASNSGGDSAPAYSALTDSVAAATPPGNAALPTIHGVSPPEVDEALTTDPGTWSGTPAPTFAYIWLGCTTGDPASCTAIPGATTNTYTPVQSDLGKRLRISVTAHNVAGQTGPILSDATEPVAPSKRPVNVVLPTITGTLSVGQTLTGSTGFWQTAAPPLTFTYQWRQCNNQGVQCSDVPGATHSTYVLQPVDAGRTIAFVVTAEDQAHRKSSATSAPTAAVGAGPVNTSPPTIGGNAMVGQLLTAGVGTWQNQSGLTFTYQWRRCDSRGQSCQDIPGATQTTYRLTAADIGSTIVLTVTAKDAAGSTQSTSSSPTKVVAGVPAGQPIPVGQVSLPSRLMIEESSFSPELLRSRAPFVARFLVSDTEGHPVSGANVYLVAIPYGRIAPAGTVQTDANGWATFTLRPTNRFPLQRGYLITIFVRATKPGGDLLAGISTRRLVSVRISPPR